MKKRWPVLILSLAFTLFIAAGAMAAPAPAGSQAAVNSAQRVPDNQDFDGFFQDLFEGFSVEVSDEQMDEMNLLFTQIQELESDEDYIGAFEQWNQFYGLTDPLWESAVYDYPEFDEFMMGALPEGISAADRAELERLFNEAVALEESGDWEAAEPVWNEFDALLESCWSLEYEDGWDEDGWNEDGWDEGCWDEDCYDEFASEEWEYPSFEEFYGDEYLDDLGLNASERAEMKALYDEAVALEENGDWEAAEEKWQALWDIEAAHYDYYWANYEYPSFDEFIADFEGEFTPRALEQMRTLYDEAVTLEKSGDWEAAAEKWDALYYIMEKFDAFGDYEDFAG